MPSEPFVSIITPSYNQGQFLEQTIQSVLGQDYPHLEYIVIDGGSTDGSLEIIHRYDKQLAYWESQPDRGQAHAINKGLSRASGEILGWLNSDDILLPGAVRRAVETLAQYPQVDVVYGRLERIDEHNHLVPTPTLPKDRVEFSKALVIGECVVNQPGSFWRREIMEKAGLLDESLLYNLDYEYWIRLALAGARFIRLAEPVARFRLSPSSKTVGQTAQMALEQLQVLERLLAIPGLPGKLDMEATQIRRQARRARGAIGLHVFYGSIKQRDWKQARRWLLWSLRQDPLALFKKRWIDLAAAGLWRRLRTKSEYN